jgi:hypothetical protein
VNQIDGKPITMQNTTKTLMTSIFLAMLVVAGIVVVAILALVNNDANAISSSLDNA